jgi:hypothetical protein
VGHLKTATQNQTPEKTTARMILHGLFPVAWPSAVVGFRARIFTDEDYSFFG